METCYLAVDIGASSGRHILGSVENGKITLTEIHRFENGMKNENGTLVWDTKHLVSEVIAGIKKCGKLGKQPVTVAIDTWGVDYVLLDENGNELYPAVCYRDERTVKAMEEVEAVVPFSELYRRTGLQRMSFNTVYQLWCDKQSGKLAKAKRMLLMPEYLSYKLTGVMKNEYTDASTTGLVNAVNKDWDRELFRALGYPEDIVEPLSPPGTAVGAFLPEIAQEVGFSATVVLTASHDTASAVAACPLSENGVYISSGTWSLIGTENLTPTLSDEARAANFTNEGGVEYRYRFLKNIMGMWLLQSIRRDLNKRCSYDEMMELARSAGNGVRFDANAQSLVAPENMLEAIRKLTGKDLSVAEALGAVYTSLAGSYDAAIKQIEALSGKTVDGILIVGGGSKDKYLNELTAKYTGKPVRTGLTEATALGNLLVQVMAHQNITLSQAREIVKNSFEIKEFKV